MRILFVCTGNVFRSMTAELVLKQYIADKESNWNVASAGTVAKPQNIHPQTKKTLTYLGIRTDEHQQTKLTKEHLKQADIVISMSTDHKECIQNEFASNTILFNKIVRNQDTPLLDNWEAVTDYKTNKIADDAYVKQVVLYIYQHIPLLYTYIHTNYISTGHARK